MALQKCSNSCSGETFRNGPTGRRQVDSTDLADPASASRPGPSRTRGSTRRTVFWRGPKQEASGQADRPDLRCDDSLLIDRATPNSGDSFIGQDCPSRGIARVLSTWSLFIFPRSRPQQGGAAGDLCDSHPLLVTKHGRSIGLFWPRGIGCIAHIARVRTSHWHARSRQTDRP